MFQQADVAQLLLKGVKGEQKYISLEVASSGLTK